MSLSLKFEQRPGYLFIEVTGRYSIEAACGMFRQGVREFTRRAQRRVLVNALQVTGAPRTMDHYKYGEFVAAELAELARKTKREPPRLAYVASAQILDRERLAQLVAGNRGVTMASFESMDEALAWLGVATGARTAVPRAHGSPASATATHRSHPR
jgi:hypothetical protein